MKSENKKLERIIIAAIIFTLVLLLIGVGWLIWLNVPNSKIESIQQQALTEDVPQQKYPVAIIGLDEQNKSNQKGTVQFEGLPEGKTKVTISLIGPVNQTQQPAHIHIGTCPTPGAVKYPLKNVIVNFSETVLDVSIESLFTSGKLAVNVHKSAKELSTYTACGNLPEAK